MRQLATAATHATRDAARPRLVSWLGIDEHRFRTMATLSSPAMLTRILNGGLRTLLIDEADRPLDPKKEGIGDRLPCWGPAQIRGPPSSSGNPGQPLEIVHAPSDSTTMIAGPPVTGTVPL
jgi:hypothetical protein